MQKKLIALAVAGLMSGAAFAQSNVTVYGVVDAGYSSWSGSEVGAGGTKKANRNAIDSSNQATSRLGFRGTEDLGNGLSAGFTYEFGLTNDAERTVNAPLSDRVQILTLSSKTAGTMVLGRLVNPARALVIAQDPFGGNGVGSAQNIQAQTTWADNVIAYASPNMSGFDVTAGYTYSLSRNEAMFNDVAQKRDLKGWVLVPKYAAGPITAGLSYENFDRQGSAAGNQNLKLRRWNLAGSYDFGVAKIGATWGSVKMNDDAAATGGTKIDQWMLSGWVPVGANGTVLVSYNKANVKPTNALSQRAHQWALGYNHAMSKRTNAYVTWASISTNDQANGRYSVAAGQNPLGDTTTDGYLRGLNIGLRHNF